MKLKTALKIFFINPLAVLKFGVLIRNEAYHLDRIKKEYNIDQLPTINMLDLFPSFEESLDLYSYLDGTSMVIDIMLLKSLARKFEKCEYLEIGSWRGESIANVAEVAHECTSISLSDMEMRSLGFSERMISIHGIFSKSKTNIKSIKHNSLTFDFDSLNKKYDLIFVDGDHQYESVKSDTENVFKLRKNKKSIIVWHDYGENTEDVRYSVFNAILDGIPKDKHKNLYHVSNTMCAIYMEDETLSSEYVIYPSIPNKVFSIDLKTKSFIPK